jgi:pimeloyl-ACP methyl ester carboxylesterase
VSVAPFEVRIPEEELADLRRRLRATRWADDFGNEDWHYGVERGWLQQMVAYWADEFDWRAQEAEINRFPQYRAVIDGVPIHFIHVRGKGPSPKPIILSHGWPWTFWDWKDVILPLSDPAAYGGNPNDAFDVVVPSLPGFGFSVPLRTVHIGPRDTAGLWVKLMQQVLGYGKFAAAGGDFGAFITSDLGHLYPEAVTGIYLTLAIAPGLLTLPFPDEAFAPEEAWMAEQGRKAFPTITSHVAVHAADSQTLAYAMADSPVGTAAWIWKRRRDWSGCQGDLVALHGRDFLCTTASIYWFNKSLGTSFRYYVEHYRAPWVPIHNRRPAIPVPTGIGISPKDVVMIPRAVMEEHCNVQRYTIFDRGGHFTPSENPEGVVNELREFFRGLP